MSAAHHPPRPPAGVGITVEVRGTTTTIELRGECDLVGQPALHTAITEVLAGDPECIVLDLGGLTFIDVTGITIVAELVKRAEAESVHLVILPGSAQVQRVFALYQKLDALPFIPTLRPREPGG